MFFLAPQWIHGFLCIFCVVWASWRASGGSISLPAAGLVGDGVQGVALSRTATVRAMGSRGVGVGGVAEKGPVVRGAG